MGQAAGGAGAIGAAARLHAGVPVRRLPASARCELTERCARLRRRWCWPHWRRRTPRHSAVLRANQDLDIQTRLLDIKTTALTEADNQITALQNQKALVQIRLRLLHQRSRS